MSSTRSQLLLAQEMLDAQQVLQVTGLRRSAPAQTVLPVPVAAAASDNGHA